MAIVLCRNGGQWINTCEVEGNKRTAQIDLENLQAPLNDINRTTAKGRDWQAGHALGRHVAAKLYCLASVSESSSSRVKHSKQPGTAQAQTL